MPSGAVAAALLIFGPARRRLRAVEEAARRLGGGDLAARAPVRGGDEVTAMAATFNAMADDLAARANALAAADRVRRQLLADVSHELTTPITAMRGYLETLTMPEFALDDQTRARYLAIVGDETARLERLIGDLLDLAKLEGGGGAFVVEEVPIAELFARVAARHEREAAGAGVSIVSRIEPGAERVRGDRGRLEQALQNLAANALRYAPRGSSIELRGRPTPGGIAHHRNRFRARYSPGARAARLRSVLQGRRGADADRRERAGPVDRQGDRRAARGNDCRGEPAGTDGV